MSRESPIWPGMLFSMSDEGVASSCCCCCCCCWPLNMTLCAVLGLGRAFSPCWSPMCRCLPAVDGLLGRREGPAVVGRSALARVVLGDAASPTSSWLVERGKGGQRGNGRRGGGGGGARKRENSWFPVTGAARESGWQQCGNHRAWSSKQKFFKRLASSVVTRILCACA